MRVSNRHVLTLASAALFYGVALSQESTTERAAPSMSQTELKPGDVRASNLLGAMVKRLTGDQIGEVEELIVSAEADVRLAVISVGGILGLGAKNIAVPFDQFTVAPDGSTVYLTISEEELRARPAFDLDGPDADQQLAPTEPAVRDQQTATQPSVAPTETHTAPANR